MSNNNNNNSTSTFALLEAKLANCKEKFAAEILESGAKSEVDNFKAVDVIAQLITAKLMWGLLEDQNTEFILGLVEAGKTPKNEQKVDSVLRVIRLLPEDKIALLWRYIKFFLNCTKSLTAGE